MQNIASMIRTPRKQVAINTQEYPGALEKINTEKLGRVVNGSIKAISIMNNMSKDEVVRILGKVHVAALNEVQEAVKNLDCAEDIDVIRLTVGIEETIKAIAETTHLDVDEITGIFARKNSASIEDIINRLHAESRTTN